MKHGSTPKRKRLNRKEGISRAKSWLATYEGKNIVRGYAKWFGVDLLCAIAELRKAGVAISDKYEQEERRSYLARVRQKITKRELSAAHDQDGDFDFIAGYTSGGVPFGLRKDDTFEDDNCMELPF